MSKKNITSKDFTDILQKSLSKKFKDKPYDVITVDERGERTDPTKFLSTGDDVLDLIISNRKNGGIPFGRYLNIYSDSGLGKSLIVQKLIANVQKMGGTGVYFDTEGGIYTDFMRVLGVNTDELVYFDEINTVEDIFEVIIEIVVTNLENDIDNPMVIAVDSMTAVTTRQGADLSTMEEAGYGEGARKQKLINGLFRKTLTKIKQDNIVFVTTDQIRDKINNAGWGRNWKDTAGWAQKFYSDIRLEMTPRGSIKNKNGDEIGNKVNVKVVKSRISPKDKDADMFIYGTRGLDKYKSLIEKCKELDIINKTTKVKYPIGDGKFWRDDEGLLPTEMEFKRLLKNDASLYDEVYSKLADKMIIKYESEDVLIDDEENTIEPIDNSKEE